MRDDAPLRRFEWTPELRETAERLLARDRAAQGLPPRLEDPVAIARVAELLRPAAARARAAQAAASRARRAGRGSRAA